MWVSKRALTLLAGILLTCFSSNGQSDSVRVPIESIRKANLKFVELDECLELSDSLRSAITSALNTLHSKNLEISTLKDQKSILEQISGNQQKMVENLSWEVRKQKRNKVLVLILAGVGGYLVGRAVK